MMSNPRKTGISRFVSCFLLNYGLMLAGKGGKHMDQKKIGQFLQTLRKEKELTQEQLAERFNVSNRTVSRWETGSNMPDISVLVELAEFYQVDIKEIIDGERKSETMNEETKETLVKVAEYTNEDKKQQYLKMRKIIGGVLMGFGVFLAVSALAIFPRDSSWGSIYSTLGAIILSVGVYQLICKNRFRLICSIGCFMVAFVLLIFTDYLGVRLGHQVPRFTYVKEWGEDEIIMKAPFYTVIWHNYDRENEYIELVD